MIKNSKTPKGHSGVCNWSSINILNCATLDASLQEALKGKFVHVEKGPGQTRGRCRVPRDKILAEYTAHMKGSFEAFKDAIPDKTALNIPSTDGEYPIPCDASDLKIGAVLEQQTSEGTWAPCVFLSRKREGSLRKG